MSPDDELDSAKKVKWVLAAPKKDFKKFFKTHQTYTEYIPEFEIDVTENPFSHKTPKKIVKLQPADKYPTGSYRWKKRDLRIVYSVSKPDKLIWPLDADTAGNIGYRK